MMAPVQSLHAHFCGIHIAKSNPKFQLVAQHYCMSRSEEMHQCLLCDSYEKNAKLLGVEYIVSDRIYRELPDAEKKYPRFHFPARSIRSVASGPTTARTSPPRDTERASIEIPFVPEDRLNDRALRTAGRGEAIAVADQVGRSAPGNPDEVPVLEAVGE